MSARETAREQHAAGVGGVAAKVWNENILFSVLVELTYRCNLDCFFCYNDTSLQGTPLTREQYFGFLEDLADLQVLYLALSGGEPLAHPHFFEIGARARELGFVVRVKSNGHAVRGELARRLKTEVDPYIVEVSLHGATAEVHDRQTQVEGSFDQLMANLEKMADLGLRTQLNCALTAWNEHQIEEMLALSDRLQLKMFFDPEVTPRDDGDTEPLGIRPSREGIRSLFSLLDERAADAETTSSPVSVGPEGDTALAPTVSDKHCGAGSSTVAIDPYGEVYPCVQWRRSVGNLHETSIGEIWRQSATLEEVRETSRQVKTMVGGYGERGARMGFCPGAAWVNTGSPVALYGGPLDRLEVSEAARADASHELFPVVK